MFVFLTLMCAARASCKTCFLPRTVEGNVCFCFPKLNVNFFLGDEGRSFIGLGINEAPVLASCNANTCTGVLSTHNCLHAICVFVYPHVYCAPEFCTQIVELDKTQNGVFERGKSGWSSSQSGCFAYHYGDVI